MPVYNGYLTNYNRCMIASAGLDKSTKTHRFPAQNGKERPRGSRLDRQIDMYDTSVICVPIIHQVVFGRLEAFGERVA